MTVAGTDQYLSGIFVQGCPDVYAASCSEANSGYGSPVTGRAVIDADGDGVDELVNFGTSFFGVADFKGNGKQAAAITGNPLTFRRKVNGAWTSEPSTINCSQKCYLADINGDGATDVIQTEAGKINVHLWTGRAFQSVVGNFTSPSVGVVRDIDNDGEADILTYPNSSSSMAMNALWFEAPGARVVADGRTIVGPNGTADVNGDGIPDFGYENGYYTSSVNGGNPNLLRSVVLETGGVLKVD